MTTYFDLQGASLAVTASDPALVQQFGRIFDGVSHAEPPSPVCFQMDIVGGEPEPVSQEGDLLYVGPVFDEGECVSHLVGDEIVQVFPGALSLRLNQEARQARMVVAPDHRRGANNSSAILAMCAALRVSGQLPVHCAGLTLPDGRLVLIIGQSGAGKTTTALALSGAGFGLCSDDVMVCRIAEDGVYAWGLPRSLKVHSRTAQMLPWAAPMLRGEPNSEDERALPLTELRNAGRVEDQSPRRVAALYVLARADAPDSAVESMSAVDILSLAAADNLRSSRVGVLADQAVRFGEMAQLIRRVPGFRLVAGRNPADLGETIVRHLGGLA